MSADNWADCPKCFEAFNASVEEANANLKKAYGKISAEKYILASQAVSEMNFDNRQSLREDWEIGIFKGEFYIRYRAGCDKCGFSFEFKKGEKLKL